MTKIITNQTNQTKNRIKFYSYEVKTHKIGQGLQITEEKEYKLCQVKGSQIRTERLITGTGQVVTKWSKTGAKITQWENKLQIAAKHQCLEKPVHCCYAKGNSEKFHKIHSNKTVPESLF